ncbi:peptidase domain-containing ABC transporter [Pedobacter sp. D749]|uniref:peptidase domain-containing ABC transporter n=1 Tax=Pedobacter sp. D749 TaxID=2856523 RepID=UPI001C59E077|nr:peptidase domain-containing ABC transporter [Pedobacter sp. D749]QXU43167.1 peptidase domain-containing ABC transporter [Pedobacter sp. D749]
MKSIKEYIYDLFYKFPHFSQLESNDCGPACLKIIFEYYNYKVPFDDIRNRSKLDWKGTSLYRIESIAKDFDFNTISISVTWDKLSADAILPAIVMIQQKHFAVLYEINAHHVLISDPAIGRLRYTIAEFKTIWESESGEGIALLLHPTKPFTSTNFEKTKNKKFYREVEKYVSGNKGAFALIFLGLLLGSLIQLLLPFSTQLIVDEGINYKNVNLIVLICLGQFVLIISKAIIDLIRRWILVHMATLFNISLIYTFLLKLIKLPLAYFEFKSHGDLLQRIEDHKRIDRLINSSSLNAAFSAFTFILYGFILLTYNKVIFVFFLVFSIIYFLYNICFSKYRKILDYKRFQKFSESSDSIFQMIFGINEIKIYQAEHQKLLKWKNVQADIFKINIQSSKLLNFQEVGSLFLSEIKNFGILFYCSLLVIRGDLTLGMMLSVQYIVGLLSVPLYEFIIFMNDFVESRAAYERIVDIYEFPDEQHELSLTDIVNIKNYQAPKSADLQTSILFNDSVNQQSEQISNDIKTKYVPEKEIIDYNLDVKNASFTYQKSYANDDNLFKLKNINFSLTSGKKTAIVGSSGSGKTTLLKVILRFYPIDDGNIFLNNDLFYNIPVDQWRSLCSPVLQDGYIFSDTIANNIALGDANPHIDKVTKAARVAEIFDFVNSLPGKFETFIGGNGHGLSQGQKQRILIARAIYKDSPFFFFDEATSSLDSLNERNIMDNIYNSLGDKTMLIIAHRLSTVIRADEILVMDNGEIVERGNHTSLVAQKGMYYNLVKNQLDLAKE